jgi:diaminohydroxyphosphoribosylaminopyrimidine deaminase/5-amino-6-(5-phosphoribosylamino)uracil reductase
MSAADDDAMMDRALALARRAWGATHPNPMVGAVIAEDGRVVAEGFHERDGGPHAEKAALVALGRSPRPGATLYVTLEPCSTQGRTGSCTEAILASGIRRVVAGATDPSPAHAGRGYQLLREAGVEVAEGVLGAECEDLNLIFNHWAAAGEPLLAGKFAATLDGRVATRTGQSQWITGEAARADAHRWRRLFPAMAVGAGTVLADNPRLTARGAGSPEHCPIRFVFDSALRTASAPVLPALYTDEFAAKTIVVAGARAHRAAAARLESLGVGVWSFDVPGAVPLAAFRARCAAERIPGVLLEGGPGLLSRALAERELDYLFAYQAPVLLADDGARAAVSGLETSLLSRAIRLGGVRRETLGEDGLVRGRVLYPD